MLPLLYTYHTQQRNLSLNGNEARRCSNSTDAMCTEYMYMYLNDLGEALFTLVNEKLRPVDQVCVNLVEIKDTSL